MTEAELAVRAGRPRDDARERAILDAAIELLAEVGYERLTVDGVAVRARASKATIYRRWPGKEDLVVAAVKERVPEPIEIPDLGSLPAELDDAMRQLCAHIGGLDGNILFGLAGACHSDPGLAACFKEAMSDKDSPMRPVVIRGVARGELASADNARLLEEVTVAVAFMRSLKGGPLDESFIAHLVDDIALPVLLGSDRRATPARAPSAQPPPIPPPTGAALRLAKESR